MSTLKKSYLRGSNESPLIYNTIGNHFDSIVDRFPDREALVVKHQNIRWSYREYQQQINRLATGLLNLGIQPGDRVGIWAPNCYEWCLTQYATAKIGAVLVCINPAYRAYELEYALNKVECRAIIAAETFKTSNYLEMLQALAPELAHCPPGKLSSNAAPRLEMVIRMGSGSTPGMLNFDGVCELGEDKDYGELEQLKQHLDPDDAINIQFTSGTTGAPKGAALSHFNILNNAEIVGRGMNFSEHDRLCIPVPLYHCFGMVMGSLTCMARGATAVFPDEAFEASSVLRTVEAEKCTALHGVPTMFINELECPGSEDFDLSSLRTGIMAGAICPEPIMKCVIEDMHMPEVTIMYGQTETSPVNHMTSIDDPINKRVQTVGRCGPHQEIKIIDEHGRLTAIGEKGELCCRGYSVMQAYWGDDKKTAETIDRAGWLHSGDLAVMDDEGYVQIVGRLKDMIIRGGENIYPKEVEEFLYTHPMIQEVQVFGIPDERYGEEICAWVQVKEQESLGADEIRDYCKDQITHFKIPRHIKIVDEFPMTVTGKIQKFKMREATIEELA